MLTTSPANEVSVSFPPISSSQFGRFGKYVSACFPVCILPHPASHATCLSASNLRLVGPSSLSVPALADDVQAIALRQFFDSLKTERSSTVSVFAVGDCQLV